MRKLLFFDIDGTLCMPGEAPTARTVEAIRRARARGHLCFLSTGRAIVSIPAPVADIGFDGCITNAGATAQVGERMLVAKAIPPDILRETMDRFYENRVCFVLQTNEGNYSDFELVNQLWHPVPPEIEAYVEITRRLLDVQDLSRLGPTEPVYKCCFYTPFPEGVAGLRRSLSRWYSFTMFDNLFDNLDLISGEINQLSADKGQALLAFCDYFHADVNDTIAFGDSTNDLEMLRTAGMGIAMANAQPELKQYADCIAPDCREDGVARMMEQLGLI